MAATNDPAGDSVNASVFPPLPLEGWGPTKETLHRFVQIVGKVRLASAPPQNHWWHVPLYVTTRGLTTSPMPHGERTFALDFDLVDHRLVLTDSGGATDGFPLADGLSVARFYASLFERLAALGIGVAVSPTPFGIPDPLPFPTDEAHAAYDAESVARWWRILVEVDQVFKAFAGRFTGKTSPVHLFWHSLDLVVTRFSGRPAPARPGADRVTREAYSHEVVSFGFWPGDARMPAPAFYSYTAPEPPGLDRQPLRPEPASWVPAGGSNLALLPYDDLRREADPRAALLAFLESAYQAGARAAGWDVAAFTAADRG